MATVLSSVRGLVAALGASLLGLAACGGGASATDVDAGADLVGADAHEIEVVDIASDPGPQVAATFTVVDVPPETPAPLQLAVQACAGLYNRALGGSVYTRMEAKDDRWLDELGLVPAETLGAQAFVEACLARFPTCVRYAYEGQRTLLPNVLTVGAVLGAVPLDVGLDVACAQVAFDATVEFATKSTPAEATELVAQRYLADTTGLAMLNPGYEINAADPSVPALTRDMPAALVDFVFSARLFVVFLVNGCVASSPEHPVLDALVNDSPWPRPVGVYGYNNSWMLMGGYLYEAQTKCLESRNMGAIASETTNLSFFATRRAPVTDTSELQHNPPEQLTYDPATTYVAFVVGDGDNVQFLMSTRNVWLGQRLEACARPDGACPPLTWSLSPHLATIAPDILDWYYRTTAKTGHDYFVLPPSGHLYAYPSSLNEADQQRFVAATEADARVMGTAGTVHWDWRDSWHAAEDVFLPRYARVEGAIRGIFPVNVPYMFEAFPWWEPGRFFEVLTGADGGEVVVFRPREWRGIDGSGTGATKPFFLTPAEMADEIGAYPPGTVTWVYLTSDGGLSLENSFLALPPLLPAHVQLVSADAAATLALQAFHTSGGPN
jgi:hypothetical protein